MAFPNNGAPQRKQLPLDDQRMKLYGAVVSGATKRPVLTFGYVTRKFVANMASITVKTQVPNDANNGNIKAEIPMALMYSIRETAMDLLTLPGAQERIRGLYTDFLAGKKMDQPVKYASLIVGKEDDGRLYLALVSRNRPSIKFHIAPDDFFREVTKDGQEMNTSEYYSQYARGYMNMIFGVYDNLTQSEFIGWTPNDNQQGNNQNGNGNNNQYSGGGNNQSGGQQGNWSNNNDAGGDDLWV